MTMREDVRTRTGSPVRTKARATALELRREAGTSERRVEVRPRGAPQVLAERRPGGGKSTNL